MSTVSLRPAWPADLLLRWTIVDQSLTFVCAGLSEAILTDKGVVSVRCPALPVLCMHDLKLAVWCAQVGFCMDALHRLSRHGTRAASLESIDTVRGSRWLTGWSWRFVRAGHPEVLEACGRVLDDARCLLPKESLCRTPVA